jgi:hypothetical protein
MYHSGGGGKMHTNFYSENLKRGLEVNIKMDLIKTGCGDVVQVKVKLSLCFS